MKKIKSFIAMLLVIVLALSFTACHEKGEVAITAGDYKITSAMYSYYLMLADSEAKQIINEDTEKYDTSAKGFSYFKQEIEGKKFETYVKELAIKKCITAIAYQKICDEKGLKLDDKTIENAENSVAYYWNYYGYSQMLPANGIGFETYLSAVKNDYLGDTYFKHIYDKNGEKEVSAAELQKELDENFAAVYLLTKNYSSDANAKVEDIVSKMEEYKTKLQNGESFEKIYKEFNEIKEEDKNNSSSSSSSTEENSSSVSSSDSNKNESNTSSTDNKTEEKEPEPKDSYISVVGSKDTDYSFEKFDEVKAMALEEIKIISDTENKVVYFIVKKDINADNYYKDTYLASTLLYMLRGDEFEAMIDEYAQKIEYTVDDFAISQFKVKSINYGN